MQVCVMGSYRQSLGRFRSAFLIKEIVFAKVVDRIQ